ncbi:hypothetical protein OIU79_029336 [Salix purpurea]|uniref:Uncharacterized protein n=1 Tax=Salix purpurea TaxID=77065 RepID=A0A9Q0VG38_SALPP|nr:hypothetical protein OIU79_029336 [Salix purpurea]
MEGRFANSRGHSSTSTELLSFCSNYQTQSYLRCNVIIMKSVLYYHTQSYLICNVIMKTVLYYQALPIHVFFFFFKRFMYSIWFSSHVNECFISFLFN